MKSPGSASEPRLPRKVRGMEPARTNYAALVKEGRRLGWPGHSRVGYSEGVARDRRAAHRPYASCRVDGELS